jgi:DNA-directed RNA polymerase subunit K/omega
MIQLPENFDSIFRYIEVVSQRAEQLIRGARPRTEVRAAKPTLQARDDVDGGAVDWRILTQEELDAQRQAMVEQFRAEMESVEEEPVEGVVTPDVLPTSGGDVVAVDAVPPEDDVDADDELQRLKRLLGMAGATIPDLDGEVSVEDADSTEAEGKGDVALEADASETTDDEVDEKG